MRLCDIVYVKEKQREGWIWRSVSRDGEITSSPETFGLFYECVTAARASGYTPSNLLKCS